MARITLKTGRKFKLIAGLLLLVIPVCARSQDAAVVLADSLVKWKVMCVAKGCLMQTDVLRGASEDPPDANDFREYIGIDVALMRATQKPDYISFLVDPRAQSDQGIFIAFTKTVKDGKSWKLKLDSDGAMRLAITNCDKEACTARVPLGQIEAGKDSHNVDLIEKFLNSDHVLVLYLKDGHAYRTMVILSSFKKEYRRIMADELAKPFQKKQ